MLSTDANAVFPAESLRRMMRRFKDPSVGLVTGGTLYVDACADRWNPPASILREKKGLLEVIGTPAQVLSVKVNSAVFQKDMEGTLPLSSSCPPEMNGYPAILFCFPK